MRIDPDWNSLFLVEHLYNQRAADTIVTCVGLGQTRHPELEFLTVYPTIEECSASSHMLIDGSVIGLAAAHEHSTLNPSRGSSPS